MPTLFDRVFAFQAHIRPTPAGGKPFNLVIHPNITIKNAYREVYSAHTTFTCEAGMNDLAGVAGGNRRLFGAVSLMCLILLGTAIRAQETGSDEAVSARVVGMETLWNQAEVQKDVQALDHLLADKFIYVDIDGSLKTKPEFLDSVTNRSEHIDSVGNDSLVTRVYEGAVVVSGLYREKGSINGKPYSHRGRFTDTWVKQGNGWLCAASQSTLIQK